MADNGKTFGFSSSTKWRAVDQIDGMFEYLKAIDWTQKWLLALMFLHVLTFIFIFMNRLRTNLLVFIFALLLVLVYFSEKLNSLAAKHWKSFATEQYFDSPGLFISVIFSTPLLFNCMIIIVIWLLDSSRMMLTVTKQRKKRYQKSLEKNTSEETDREEKKAK